MKQYTIVTHRNDRTSEVTRTLPELIEYFSYTLEVGHQWERGPGRKRVNTAPKSARVLVENLNRATNAATVNGHSGTYYTLKTDPA